MKLSPSEGGRLGGDGQPHAELARDLSTEFRWAKMPVRSPEESLSPRGEGVTELLLTFSATDCLAFDPLLPLVSADLRRIALRRLRGAGPTAFLATELGDMPGDLAGAG